MHSNFSDIDECESKDPCAPNEICVNTNGSYECKTVVNCEQGFKLNADGSQCEDIDACEEFPGLCQHRCINSESAYKCECEDGFELDVDKRTCNDLDECEIYKTYKLCGGLCENIPGSYRCACTKGYRLGGDLRLCEDR